MRKGFDAHTPAEHNAGRDMNVRVDSAIMLDYRAAVNDAVFADDGAGIDDDSRHHNGSTSDPCRSSNDGGWMNEGCGREPISERAGETPCARAVITHGNDESASSEAMQVQRSTQQWAITKLKANSRSVVVQEGYALEASGASGNVQNDLSMSSSAPN